MFWSVQSHTLDDLVTERPAGRAHHSNEYTGHVKFDPRDWESQTAKSVGNYTSEKVDLVGGDVTVLTSYVFDTGFMRVFGTIDKKFKWAKNNQSFLQHDNIPISKKDIKKKVMITEADKCATEWDEDDTCKCSGNVYFGTWGSIMLEPEQKMVEKKVDQEIKCSRQAFGDDPLPEMKKECYCEKTKPLPVDIKQSDKCADEG